MSITSKKKVRDTNKTIVAIISIFFVTSLLIVLTNSNTELNKDDPIAIFMQWTARELPIQLDKSNVIQVILMDDMNNWVEGADVTAIIQSGSAKETLEFIHIDGGLYESVANFPMSGLWTGEIMAEKGRVQQNNRLEIMVSS